VINVGKKISFLGDIGVGKTTLMNKLIQNNSHAEDTDSKLQIRSKNIPIDANMLLLSFWDLGTHVSKEHIPASYYISSDAVLYVFDVTNPQSFLQIEQDLRIISEVNPNCIIKLIGNKIDLIEDFNEEEWIRKYNLTPNYFISALYMEDVELLEKELTFEFLSLHPELVKQEGAFAYL